MDTQLTQLFSSLVGEAIQCISARIKERRDLLLYVQHTPQVIVKEFVDEIQRMGDVNASTSIHDVCERMRKTIDTLPPVKAEAVRLIVKQLDDEQQLYADIVRLRFRDSGFESMERMIPGWTTRVFLKTVVNFQNATLQPFFKKAPPYIVSRLHIINGMARMYAGNNVLYAGAPIRPQRELQKLSDETNDHLLQMLQSEHGVMGMFTALSKIEVVYHDSIITTTTATADVVDLTSTAGLHALCSELSKQKFVVESHLQSRRSQQGSLINTDGTSDAALARLQPLFTDWQTFLSRERSPSEVQQRCKNYSKQVNDMFRETAQNLRLEEGSDVRSAWLQQYAETTVKKELVAVITLTFTIRMAQELRQSVESVARFMTSPHMTQNRLLCPTEVDAVTAAIKRACSMTVEIEKKAMSALSQHQNNGQSAATATSSLAGGASDCNPDSMLADAMNVWKQTGVAAASLDAAAYTNTLLASTAFHEGNAAAIRDVIKGQLALRTLDVIDAQGHRRTPCRVCDGMDRVAAKINAETSEQVHSRLKPLYGAIESVIHTLVVVQKCISVVANQDRYRAQADFMARLRAQMKQLEDGLRPFADIPITTPSVMAALRQAQTQMQLNVRIKPIEESSNAVIDAHAMLARSLQLSSAASPNFKDLATSVGLLATINVIHNRLGKPLSTIE